MKVFIRCHLRGGSRIVRVNIKKKQLTDLIKMGSSLWLFLDLRVKEKLGVEKELEILFGNVILKKLNENMFIERVVEVDLTDIPPVLAPAPVSFWNRFCAVVVAVMSHLKRAPPSTNGA